uniref:Uncharacterized protein n=1 Tax=Pavo cristatus TaxID=9049 RepID=A0A8C9EP99_PAVCR
MEGSLKSIKLQRWTLMALQPFWGVPALLCGGPSPVEGHQSECRHSGVPHYPPLQAPPCPRCRAQCPVPPPGGALPPLAILGSGQGHVFSSPSLTPPTRPPPPDSDWLSLASIGMRRRDWRRRGGGVGEGGRGGGSAERSSGCEWGDGAGGGSSGVHGGGGGGGGEGSGNAWVAMRWVSAMDDLRLHYRFLSWRRRIREIREVRAVRYQERAKHVLVDGDTLSYHGDSGEVGCYVAPRPLTRDNNYFEVRRGCGAAGGPCPHLGSPLSLGVHSPFGAPILISDPHCHGISAFTGGPNICWDPWCHWGSPLLLVSPSSVMFLLSFGVPIITRCPRPFVPFTSCSLVSPSQSVSLSHLVAVSPFPHRCPLWTAECGVPLRWGWCRSTTAWSTPPAGCPARWRTTPMTASE